MSEPGPEYSNVTMTPGVKPARENIGLVDIALIQALRRIAIAVVKMCDKILFGRDDKTIPRRR